MVPKSEMFNCQKYFEMLANLILDGVIKVFQSKMQRCSLKRGGATYNFTKYACHG